MELFPRNLVCSIRDWAYLGLNIPSKYAYVGHIWTVSWQAHRSMSILAPYGTNVGNPSGLTKKGYRWLLYGVTEVYLFPRESDFGTSYQSTSLCQRPFRTSRWVWQFFTELYTELSLSFLTSTSFNHHMFAPDHDLVHSTSTTILQSEPCTLLEEEEELT